MITLGSIQLVLTVALWDTHLLPFTSTYMLGIQKEIAVCEQGAWQAVW